MTTPEIVLNPMTEEEFAAWLVLTVQSYAQMHIDEGTWTAEEGPGLSSREFHQYLPDGLSTAEHYLYTVRDVADGESVGTLWLQIRPKAGGRQIFVLSVAVNEDKQGKGYGRATMLACERRARELGAQSVGLHVHGHNKVARSLYASLGFVETDVLMSLSLDDAES